MPDVVDKATRSRMMSGIKSKNTKPELRIRSALHRRGFRFQLHRKGLPGKPDLVLPKYSTVIFVHGCFWHGHDCHLFKMPSTRAAFWKNKIENNRLRDQKVLSELLELGWRCLVVWECSIKGRHRIGYESAIEEIANWLKGSEQSKEIRGRS